MLPERRRILALAATSLCWLSLSGAAVRAEPGGCPEQRTCPSYRTIGRTWKPYPYQTVVEIPYWINPVQIFVPESEAIAAIRRAFATWDDVLPAVSFAYRGVTTRPPVPADGLNVVGWGDGGSTASTYLFAEGDDTILGADTILSAAYPRWVSYPCQQADDSCSNRRIDFPDDWYLLPPGTPDPGPTPYLVVDIQNEMTNQVGQWLGLGVLRDRAIDQRMTMYCCGLYEVDWVEREKSTLALGDIQGAQELYPCDCPPPTVFVP